MACVSHLPHVLANVLVAQAARAARRAAERLPARRPELSRRDPRRRRQQRDLDRHLHLKPRRPDRRARRGSTRAWRRCAARSRTATPARSSAGTTRARAARDALLGARARGRPVHELRASVPNRPGVIAEIALALGRAGVNIVDMALSPSPRQPPGRRRALDRAASEHAQRAHELIADLGFPVRCARRERALRARGRCRASCARRPTSRSPTARRCSARWPPSRCASSATCARPTRSTLAAVRALGALVEERGDAVVDPRRRPARGARARAADRRRQRRHAAAPAAGLAGGAAGTLVHARRRRVDPPAPGRPDRRAAAPDGRRACSSRDGRFAPLT